MTISHYKVLSVIMFYDHYSTVAFGNARINL